MAGLLKAFVMMLIFAAQHTYASHPAVLIDSHDVNLTHFQMSYFIDHSEALSFEEVRAQAFTPSPNQISLGTNAKTTWTQVEIKNLTDQPRRLFLHQPQAYHNRQLVLYEQQTEGYKQQQLEMDTAANSPLMYRGSAIFEFWLDARESKRLYVKSVSFSHQWFSLLILDEDHSRRALQGIGAHNDIALMVGILLALVIYNFLLYFSSNKKENIFYSLYLISGAIWVALSYGLLASLFNIYGADTLRMHLSLISMPVFLILFMMDIFQTGKHHLREHRFLQCILLLLVLNFVYGLFDIVPALRHTSSLAALMMLVTISVTISLLRKGNPLAKYFLFGHSLFVIFSGVAVLFYKGIIGFNYISSHGVGIGIMLESLMLAFIISYRIKMLEDIKASQDELKLLAVTDPLTRLYNRRYFYTEANYLFEQARKTGMPLALLIIDIDRFKAINDGYGHQVGDQVIVALSDLLRLKSRKGELIARFGGEEFVMLLPNTSEEKAQQRAEQIRAAAQSLNLDQQGDNLSFTISIGGVEIDSERETIDTAINLADIALYEAKNTGRNCVRFSECQLTPLTS